MKNVLALAAVALLSSACFHAVIETGLPAGTQVINQPMTMSFVDGLVAPAPVNVASRCPNGVARVETQHSFVNGLIGAVTLGIVTPMTITVTCAASRTSLAPTTPADIIVPVMTRLAIQAAFAEAADRTVASGVPVTVQLPVVR